MIYRFRAILDTHEDVFRDLEIQADATLEDLHNILTQAFGFAGQEMASFYISNDQWEQGEEIALFDMSEEPGSVRIMEETALDDVVHTNQTKLIYVYDFLNMWTFLVELAEVAEPEDGRSYPNLMFAHGHIPDEAPDKQFVAEESSEDALDLDTDDYDQFDFDENWN